MANPDVTILPEEYETFDLTMRLSKDLLNAAKTLTSTQQRILVDTYYQVQEDRKARANQLRAAQEQPNEFLVMLSAYLMKLERTIVAALDASTDQSVVGRWCKSLVGIGPVLTAGLAAHIDIRIAKTVSALERYGGIDPSMKWHGTEDTKSVIETALKVEPNEWHAFVWICQAFNLRPSHILVQAKLLEAGKEITVERAKRFAVENYRADSEKFSEIEYYGDNVFLRSLSDPADAFEAVYPDVKFDWKALQKVFSKRPWNAKLKTLLWKVGDSFCKFHNHENCFYGHIYAARKQLEIERNESGVFAAQAAETLQTRNIQDRDTRAVYQAGKLPAGRLELRARRIAVKLFLSHYFEIAYMDHYKQPPPKPYILVHDSEAHTQYVPPPNWPLVE